MSARIALVAALVLAPAFTGAQAQLVTRPIIFVVPYSPGGNVDVSARILQAGIGDALGQPIIVENKPGAGGMLAGDYVARAEPDGQTLFVGSNGPLVLGPMAMPNAPYQWDKVFAPVSSLAVATNVLLVNPQLPIHSVAELVAYAKANPGKLTLETDTPVSINHFMAELFRLKTSIDWVEVNYHGNAPALADLIAGHVDIGFQQLVDAVQLIKDGKLRALAVLGTKRAVALPDVPTIAEAGAESNPAPDRGQAQRHDPRGAAKADGDRSTRRAWLRGRRQHTGSIYRFSYARYPQVERRHETSQHKGVGVNAVTRPFSPKIDRNYAKPKLKLPPGACDTHFHFIGPQKLFPLKPNHVFGHLEFEDTPIEDWLKMQDALGLSRGLHVQSMMYENNYEIVLHGQCRFPDRLRAVVVPWPGITDRELEILTVAGVVGYRITHRLGKSIDQKLVARTHEHGWSMHYLVKAEEQQDWKKPILNSPGRFVLEHMGGIDPAKGIDGEGFKFVLQCLDTGRCWVKLSPRISKEDNFPFSDTDPLVKKLVEHAPTRLLWGSDWPHPQYFKPMPNDVALLDMMLDWVPDEATRKLIFVDNPADIFGFPPVAST
jgi:tripartite-type tricarboxylate transporter receptor subunit TctC/predicted TIM-barrel fold metal-dependent hydrolase